MVNQLFKLCNKGRREERPWMKLFMQYWLKMLAFWSKATCVCLIWWSNSLRSTNSLLLATFDRLVEQMKLSIIEGDIKSFDLHCMNNFVSRYGKVKVVMSRQQKRVMMRPLLSKLQEGTSKRYKGHLEASTPLLSTDLYTNNSSLPCTTYWLMRSWVRSSSS